MELLELVLMLLAVAVAGAIGALFGHRLGVASAQAEAGVVRGRLETLEAEQEREREATELRHAEQLQQLRTEAELRLRDERRRGQEALAELQNDAQRRADEFAQLSSAALERNSAVFLAQAEERLKRSHNEGAAELAKREDAVRKLVEPLTKSLETVKGEVSAAEKARAEAGAALTEQLTAMRTSSEQLTLETRQLVTALRAPQVRGRWGEMQLRRVVEAAGMVEHVDFTEQAHRVSDDGALRPDMLVHLPGAKQVIVDAKVAFNGYLEAMEARDDTTRTKRLDAHARHLRDHIDQLGSKAYWEAVEGTPEFVVMFVPAETFLSAALERDPTLFERAFKHDVVLATPATLVALLRTVAYTWRQEQLTAEAQQVLTVGRDLHKRLGTMGAHLTTLGKRLNSTVEAFNAFNSSLDRNVVTQARRFSNLQGLDAAMEPTPPLEVLAVAAQKPDVHGEDPAVSAGDENGVGAQSLDKSGDSIGTPAGSAIA